MAERVFPRGGQKPALSKPFDKFDFRIFGQQNKKKVKYRTKKKIENEHRKYASLKDQKIQGKEKKESHLIIKYVDDLTPTIVQDGMLVLGIVSTVTEKVVTMSLPGGIRGVVTLSHVPQLIKDLIVNPSPKSKVLSLSEFFRVGEILPAKVLSISNEDKYTFLLSLDPQLINSKLGDMEEGLIMTGSIKSEEDHGFVIDFGIPLIQGFLNFEKVPDRTMLRRGKLVRCAIIKCINTLGSCSVELSLLPDDLKNGKLSPDSTYPIHAFIPGFQFELTVEKIYKNGVGVCLKKDKGIKGFIYEDYLPSLFPKLDKIQIGAKYTGVLLYTKPLLNTPYFKIFSRKPENWLYSYGRIVSGKVIKSTRAGVTFRIGTKLLPMKCYVPSVKLSDAEKLIESGLHIENLYPPKKVVNEIRLGMIDYMKRCYFGSADKASLEEKYFAVSNLKCGEIIRCRVISVEDSQIRVQIGKTITGIVDNMDLTDIPTKNPGSRFKVDQRVQARVMEVDLKTRFVRLTMKPTLMKKKLKMLMKYEDAKKNDRYTGTLFMVTKDKLIVKFFNGVMGHVPKHLTQYKNSASLEQNFEPGQLVKCYVVGLSGEANLQLSLLPKSVVEFKFKIGEKYEVTVTHKTSKGLILDVGLPDCHDTVKGLIPCELIADYPGQGKSLMETYSVNDKFTAYHVLNRDRGLPLFAVAPSICNFYEILGKEHLNPGELLVGGHVYPFLFSHVNFKTSKLVLSPLIPAQEEIKFTVSAKNISDDKNVTLERLPLGRHQLVYGLILWSQKNYVEVSLKLSHVWDKNYHNALDLLDCYLNGMKQLLNHHRKADEEYLHGITLGCKASADANIHRVENPIHEVKRATAVSDLKEDENGKVKGKVVWIMGEKKFLCLNTSAECMADINSEQDASFNLVNTFHRARIVYIGEDVVVAGLKGKGNGTLVFLPRKRHVNDFLTVECPYHIGYVLRVWVERGKLNNLVGIDRQVTLLEERIVWKSYAENLRHSLKSLKRKLPENVSQSKIRRTNEGESDSDMEIIGMKLAERTEIKEEEKENSDDDIRCEFAGISNGVPNGNFLSSEIKQEEDSEMGEAFRERSAFSDGLGSMDMEIKSENDSDEDNKTQNGNDIYTKERIFLSSSSESDSDDEVANKGEKSCKTSLNVGFNWDVLKNRDLLSGANVNGEEESSGDEKEEDSKKTKRDKLTKKEKEEKARLEEERLRQVEERLMKTDVEPETANDFDRALLGKPNSSALWVKYMAFHLQATEIEKARTIARRALKTIAFNEEQEKLNVWVALLNLENHYGSEESLKKAVGEALMCNEPYQIHLHMMNLNGQSGKFQEMERLGNMLMKKFKDTDNMWFDVGLAYYRIGKTESARHVLQRALPLLEKKKHVDLISRFAQMENKYGCSERAQTLYETILASFPKRVDVWSVYVDMLVKSNMIDLARQVLERATSQHLPPKKMKTLFKKFIAFEEKHGTPENVNKVRESALDYVETIGKKR